MGLKRWLIGHEVKICYDRHNKRLEAGEQSECETLIGTVEGVYKNMILLSHRHRETYQTTQKMLFAEKTVEEEKEIEEACLLNRKYIIRIDILDWDSGEENEPV